MPRRALLLLTALVLILHWLVLVGLPLGGGAGAAPQPTAFHTRMLSAPPAAPPAPQAAPAPAPRAREPGKPVKPRPRPAPAAPPAATEDSRADSPVQSAPPAPIISPMEAEAAPASTEAAMPGSDSPAAPQVPPTTAEAAEPDKAAAAEPEKAAAAESAETAGVEIRPPGQPGARASSEPPPVLLPPSTRLSFDVVGEVKKFHYNASAELLWRQQGQRYEARQQIKAFLLGARTQTSVGSITPQGLQPERFGDKSRSERAAHFDFERHEVIFSANTPRATIGAGAQDRLSVFLQLGAMLAAAPERYPPGTQITLTTVGARHADRWTFSVQGPETLDLPAGSTPALKLERLPQADQQRDQKAELWLGTALHYLPVRIRLTQGNGDFADLLLSGHEAP